MLNFKKSFIVGLVAAGIGLTSLASFAQMPPPDQDWHHGHPPSAEQKAKFEQWRAKRQAKLHDKLKITAAQEDAWKTFITKTTPVRPATPPVRLSREEWSKLTTPALLEQKQAFLAKRQEHFAQHIAAVKEFYAVLSPEQQKLFDEAFRKLEKHRNHAHHFDHGQWQAHDMDDAASK